MNRKKLLISSCIVEALYFFSGYSFPTIAQSTITIADDISQTTSKLSSPPATNLSPTQSPQSTGTITIDRPIVIDTAKLQSNDTIISLFGIIGLQGDVAQQFQTYLSGKHLTCNPVGNDGFNCLLPDGTNIALAALINGAAKAKDGAPDSFKQNETDAQTARRGIWSDVALLPPISVENPIVQDTATLVASNKQIFILDGLQGLTQPFSDQLQSYITENGNRVICIAKPIVGHFTCTMDDGTDIAMVALVNGAAIVTNDASDEYRAQQAEAIANRRGIWANEPTDATYTIVDGDDGTDGITYINGYPWAWINGSFVALAFTGGVWGYWDYYHKWHSAPASYAVHMNHFHPGGLHNFNTGFNVQHSGFNRVGLPHKGRFNGPIHRVKRGCLRPIGRFNGPHPGFNGGGLPHIGGFNVGGWPHIGGFVGG